MDRPDMDLNDILGVDDPSEFFDIESPDDLISEAEVEEFIEAIEDLTEHVLTDLRYSRLMIQDQLAVLPLHAEGRESGMGVLGRIVLSEAAVMLLGSFAVSWARENYPEGGGNV